MQPRKGSHVRMWLSLFRPKEGVVLAASKTHMQIRGEDCVHAWSLLYVSKIRGQLMSNPRGGWGPKQILINLKARMNIIEWGCFCEYKFLYFVDQKPTKLSVRM